MSTGSLELIKDYLTAVGERRMDEARRLVTSDVLIVFPQGSFDDLSEVVAAMSKRYASIEKTHHTWDVMASDPGTTVVVTTGTLHGRNLHDMVFDGIRFCDRFVIRGGLIAEQHVWNDLSESGVLSRLP